MWLPLFGLLLSLFFIYRTDRSVFPLEESSRSIEVYTDKKFDQGFSTIDHFQQSEDSIAFSYTFIDSNKSLMPFAGVSLIDSSLKESFNPFVYEKVRVRLSSQERQQGYLMLTFHLGDSSLMNDPGTYIFMQRPFSVFPNKSEYEFSLHEFFYPDWWLSKTDFTFDDLKKMKRDKLWNIYLDLNSTNKYIDKNTVSLSEITFYKTYETETLLGITLLICYYSFLWFVCYLSRQHELLLSQKTKIEMPYKTIEVIDTKLVDLKLLIDVIESSYIDETFSIYQLSERTNLSTDRISILLQEHFNGANFKQYLNTVRIHAAKNLLDDHSLKVQDIALSVGYANITHFNRMFKKITGYTPTNYRKRDTHTA